MKKVFGKIILGNHNLKYNDDCVIYFNSDYLIIENEENKQKISKDNIIDLNFRESQKVKAASAISYNKKSLIERTPFPFFRLSFLINIFVNVLEHIKDLFRFGNKKKKITEVTIIYKDKSLIENKLIIEVNDEFR